MPTDRFFGDDMTLTFATEENDNSLTAAKLRNVSITVEADHVEFYSADSVLREEVKRREMAVNVEIEYAEFNEDVAQYWLQGDDTTTSTTINDTSDVTLFNVEGEVNMTDHTGDSGDESLKAVVSDVHFDEMPLIESSEGEYLSQSLSGRGKDVTFTKESVA